MGENTILLTVRFIDATEPMAKLIAVVNMSIITANSNGVIKAYDQSLNSINLKDFKGSLADLMQTVTNEVQKKYPDMILLSVNDDIRKMNSVNVLNMEITRH